MKEFMMVFLLTGGGFILGIGVQIDAQRIAAESNDITGYHCTPITYHETLDSAMEQVHKHQEKTGVLNNEAKGD